MGDYRVCDYEGSPYQQAFWGDGQRIYEDQAERAALRRLLPAAGKRLLQIGAGFGRLTDELAGYQEIVLHDYSRSMLAEARARLGDGAEGRRCRYVASDVRRLPFAPGVFDAATMIRVMHHIEAPAAALAEIRAALAEGSAFVLEFANKRNLKAMARYALKRQKWSPFGLEPVEFVELNFNFHPADMRHALQSNGFSVRRQLGVSFFRLGLLKRWVPAGTLAAFDRLLQPLGAWAPLTPSLFLLLKTNGEAPAALPDALFKCPACGSLDVAESPAGVDCTACGRRWPVRDGIYDFKSPVTA